MTEPVYLDIHVETDGERLAVTISGDPKSVGAVLNEELAEAIAEELEAVNDGSGE